MRRSAAIWRTGRLVRRKTFVAVGVLYADALPVHALIERVVAGNETVELQVGGGAAERRLHQRRVHCPHVLKDEGWGRTVRLRLARHVLRRDREPREAERLGRVDVEEVQPAEHGLRVFERAALLCEVKRVVVKLATLQRFYVAEVGDALERVLVLWDAKKEDLVPELQLCWKRSFILLR